MRIVGIAALVLAVVAIAALVASIALQAGGDHFGERFEPSDVQGQASAVLLALGLLVGASSLFLTAIWATSGIIRAHRKIDLGSPAQFKKPK